MPKVKGKSGRNPKLNPKTHCVMVRFDDSEWNDFLSMFEKSGVYARSVFHNAKSSDTILVLYCNGSFYLFLLLLPDWRSSLLSSSELSEKGLRIMLLTLLQDKFFIKNLSFFLTKAKDSSIV